MCWSHQGAIQIHKLLYTGLKEREESGSLLSKTGLERLESWCLVRTGNTALGGVIQRIFLQVDHLWESSFTVTCGGMVQRCYRSGADWIDAYGV